MNRSEKKQVVENFKSTVLSKDSLIAFSYSGVSVDKIYSLRKAANEENLQVKVLKNSLAEIAMKDTDKEVMIDLLKGPIAVIYGDDVVSCSRVVSSFVKDNESCEVVGGVYLSSLLNKADVSKISNLPSVDELRAKIVLLLQASASKVVMAQKNVLGNVVGVLKAYSEK